MDLTIPSQPALTGAHDAKPVDLAAIVKPKSDVKTGPVSVPKVDKAEQVNSDDKRFTQVKRAAENLFRDVYAVSDSRFTIFKDATGQFVTRFTNLRDGSITYFPEPDILRYMAEKSAERAALVQLDA